MISTTKYYVCFLSLVFFCWTIEVESLAADEQLGTDDTYHSPDGDALKRASAFMPMRGRREDFEEDKRGSSFQPMRGKKEDSDSFLIDDKRGSFMPVRGRKAMYSDGGPLLMLEEEEKRGSGFMPMRGRRDPDKRVSAFLPMRGRKGDSEGGKRASAFMPMRGRKNSQVGGKRISFLPMRGKKSEEEMYDEEEVTEERSDEVRRALEALANGGKIMTQEDKRKSSFFGMRGKRETHGHGSHGTGAKREAVFFATRGKRSPDVTTQQDRRWTA